MPALKPEQESLDWFDQWYAVAFVRDLQEKGPNSFKVMEQPIVVWQEPSSGMWRAFRDSCPHRLVPLSEGRIDPATGTLECPYHGWQFNATGDCTVIPEGGAIDHRCDAIVYPCAIKQGMLFVKPKPFTRLTSRVVVDESGGLVDLDELDTSDIPIVPELDDGAVTLDVARDFPYDYSLLVENLLDVGHVHFTHHATISRRENAPITTLQVKNRGKYGFEGSQDRNVPGRRTSVFQAPAFLRHTIDRQEENGSLLLIVVYAVPVSPGHCRLLNRQVFKLKSSFAMGIISRLPGWVFHPSNNVILEDDVIFLHRQMEEFVSTGAASKPIAKAYRMPYSSDAFVATFHNWMRNWGGHGPFGPMDKQWLQGAGPSLTQEQLLDRYHTHTKGCSSCSHALKALETAQRLLVIGGIACTVFSCLGTVAMLLCAASQGHGIQAAAAGAAVAQASAAPWLLRPLVHHWGSAVPPGAQAGIILTLLVAAALCVLLHWATSRAKQKYLRGTWPPPRNTVP